MKLIYGVAVVSGILVGLGRVNDWFTAAGVAGFLILGALTWRYDTR